MNSYNRYISIVLIFLASTVCVQTKPPPNPKRSGLEILQSHGSMIEVRYHRDHIPLHAEIYRPAGPGPFPTVLVIPGGFWGPNNNNRELCKSLAAKGYLAALPHLRGQGKSKGNITFCLEEGRDVRVLARALKQLGGRGDYAYVGISFGTAIALNAARNDPQVRGIAHVMGPTDFREQLADLRRIGRTEAADRWERWIGGSPRSAPNEYRKRDPLLFAREVSAPLLILQGGKDPLIPTSQASRLAHVRERLGRKVYRVAFDSAGNLWDKPLAEPHACIEPVTGLGPPSEDHLILLVDMGHTTNKTVIHMVENALASWLTQTGQE